MTLTKGQLLRDYPSPKKAELTSPLILALNRQDLDMTKFLVKELGLSVNTCDSGNRCALVYAVRTNNLRLCQLLLNVDFEEPRARQQAAAGAGEQGGRRLSARVKNLFQAAQRTADKAGDESEDVSEEEAGWLTFFIQNEGENFEFF